MSNNPFKKKKGVTQIGNFLVSSEKGTLKSIKVMAVAGTWNIRYREDNPLFSWINNQLKTAEGKKILHLVFSAFYAAANGVSDKEFLEDVVNAYSRSVQRLQDGAEQVSETESEKIIEEEKEKQTWKDGISN